MKYWITGLLLLLLQYSYSQEQGCPININFAENTLTHWAAYVGNNDGGNGPNAIKYRYDSAVAAPYGTMGATSFSEYQLSSVTGIRVITSPSVDPFGGFSSIPVINGYDYHYSILLGSTAISHGNGPRGGYIRGVQYRIKVPSGPSSEPYTMTYAYAMVLENGTHNSNQQPLFRATLATADSVITCASPSYFLPTFDNVGSGGTGAVLNTALAIQLGFSPSNVPSPNPDPNSNSPFPVHLYDVWTKGWREVTFDLSPYRGQFVTLTFESDNCVPGGHFAYAYVALRNSCAGLQITGDSLVCSNTAINYSIPSLAGATYNWTIPPGWTLISTDTSYTIQVKPNSQGGQVIAHERNGCADLKDTLNVATTPGPVGGTISGSSEFCAGAANSNTLTLSGYTGNILEWLSSVDNGINWTPITNTTPTYVAQNLSATTLYTAILQTSPNCPVDSSKTAIIKVDDKTIGGVLSPSNLDICLAQTQGNTISLTGNVGQVVNWQSSPDDVNWNGFTPTFNAVENQVNGVSQLTYFRVIVKNGACDPDTSTIAKVNIIPVVFPQATHHPRDTGICFQGSIPLNATITVGANCYWTSVDHLSNPGDGLITSLPYQIHALATPTGTYDYILNITNTGCPNLLKDTFHIQIVPPFSISAGPELEAVAFEPVQLNVTSTDLLPDNYSWTPELGLSQTHVANPIATLDGTNFVTTYYVTGVDSIGCSATDSVKIRIYNLPADIYVPTAFSPNGDGLNDIFKPKSLGMQVLYSFRVYNRWGQLLFETSDTEKGWDGNFNGVQQPPGNYVWTADGMNYKGLSIQRKGNVMLVR